MIRSIALASAFCLGAFSTCAATIAHRPIPVEKFITIGSADWAWAFACGAGASSRSFPNQFDLTEQSAYGWRLPTAAEVAAVIAPNWQAFHALFLDPKGDVRCASAWFNASWDHCDYGDNVWNLSGQEYHETFVIRDHNPAAPVPAAAGLLAAALGALGLVRRRKTA